MGCNRRYGRRIAFRWAVLLIGLAFWPLGCSSGQGLSAATGVPNIRVLLLENQKQVEVAANAPPVVHVGPQSVPQELRFPPGMTVPVSLTPAGWRVGSALLGTGEMMLEPSLDGSVRIGAKAYHGRYRFIPVAPDRFDVVNETDIESYLRGVLRSELFPNWHEEAYKAQAIVARTYALYEARTDGVGRSFDVYCDQRSQVYGGIAAETPRSREATDATAGIVVAYGSPGRETIFKSYFSSCCGGVSQSAADAFGDPYLPPLGDQKRGAVCTDSPKFNWPPVQIPKDEITRRMRAWVTNKKQPLKDMAPVVRVDVEASNAYGRPTRFAVTDAHGVRYSMRAEAFREAVNSDVAPGGIKLFSSFCKPVDRGASVLFTEGHGYGHGVGMCQWCAEHHAADGWNDKDIVLNAFPGAKLIQAY